MVIVVYIMLCLGGIAFFRKTAARWNPVSHFLVPLAGAVLFGAALYGSIYPVPPAPLKYTPYVTLVWLRAGHRGRPGAARRATRPRWSGSARSSARRAATDAASLDADPVDPSQGDASAHVIPLVDDHAHPFPLGPEPLDLDALSLSSTTPGRTAAPRPLATG